MWGGRAFLHRKKRIFTLYQAKWERQPRMQLSEAGAPIQRVEKTFSTRSQCGRKRNCTIDRCVLEALRQKLVFLHGKQQLALRFKADAVGGERRIEGRGHGLLSIVCEDFYAEAIQNNPKF